MSLPADRPTDTHAVVIDNGFRRFQIGTFNPENEEWQQPRYYSRGTTTPDPDMISHWIYYGWDHAHPNRKHQNMETRDTIRIRPAERIQENA